MKINLRGIEELPDCTDDINCDFSIGDNVKIINKNKAYRTIHNYKDKLYYLPAFKDIDINKFTHPVNVIINGSEGKIIRLFCNFDKTIIAIITRGSKYYGCIGIDGIMKVNKDS